MSDKAAPSPALPEATHATSRGDCRIVSRPAGHILQILAPPFDAVVAGHLIELNWGFASGLRSIGPGSWYLVGEAALTPLDSAEYEARLGPRAMVVDQTHGCARLEVSGPGATGVLATGTAVDLSLTRFPVGSSRQTLFGHIGVHLTRTAPDRFELLVGRSFASSLWEQLTR